MSACPTLARFEAIVDTSGVAQRIEAMLPVGVRPRQLSVRTLLIGMLLALSDGRPAHLRRAHRALRCLSEPDQRRLGVLARWKTGWHLLTYRQVERTFSLVVKALAKQKPDGQCPEALSAAMDALIEASVTVLGEPESTALAVDWTDYETFARPPRRRRAQTEGEQNESAGD